MGERQGETELAWALHRARQAEPRHALVESLDGRLRDERLHEEVLDRLAHARPASPPAGAASTPTCAPPRRLGRADARPGAPGDRDPQRPGHRRPRARPRDRPPGPRTPLMTRGLEGRQSVSLNASMASGSCPCACGRAVSTRKPSRLGARLTVVSLTVTPNSSRIHAAKSTSRQRTTPPRQGFGPASTARRPSASSCSGARRGALPGPFRSTSPEGPSALNRTIQSRTICSPTPPIRTAIVRLAPSWIDASARSLNRAGFPGGDFVWQATPPRRCSPAGGGGAPRPRRAGRARSARGACGG